MDEKFENVIHFTPKTCFDLNRDVIWVGGVKRAQNLKLGNQTHWKSETCHLGIFVDEKFENVIHFTPKTCFDRKSWRHLGLRGKKGPKFITWELNTLKVWNLSPGHICGREIRKCHPFHTKNMLRPKSWRHLGRRGKKGPKFKTWETNTLKVWNLSPGHICGREIRKCHPFYTKNMFRPKSWRHLGLRGKRAQN